MHFTIEPVWVKNNLNVSLKNWTSRVLKQQVYLKQVNKFFMVNKVWFLGSFVYIKLKFICK